MEITQPSLNLSVVYVTLIFDILFIIPLFLCIIFFVNITELFGHNSLTLRKFLQMFIGKKSFSLINQMAHSNSETIAFVLPILLATPLLCISSHIGYVLLAWVTEPSKCTTSLLLYYAIVVFFYFILRKFYILHQKKCIMLNFKKVNNVEQGVCDRKNVHTSTQRRRYTFSVIEVQAERINPQAHCIVMFYSIFLVSITMMTIFIFRLLPIASQNLISYLFNALELMIVFISTQIAFRLFFSSDFNFREAVKSFRERFAQKREDTDGNLTDSVSEIARNKNYDLEKATGAVVAEFTNIAISMQKQ